MNHKVWVIKLFICSVLLMLLVGGANFIVDPYGLFRTVEIKGFNQQKEGVRNKVRFVKALEVSLRQPKTIIMGSSRVHDGINPDYKALKEFQPAYNYGIDMARIKEIKLYLKHAIAISNIENLILGLDFFMFNASEKLNTTFDPTLVNNKPTFLDLYYKPLFTMTSVSDSIQTIKISAAQEGRKEFLTNGFRPGDSVFYGVKDYEKLHSYTNWIFSSSKESDTLYYSKMTLDEEVFDDFEEIVSLCKVKNINCTLYISPAHANLDGEGIKAAGLLPIFEEWKQKIVSIAYDNHLTLWDFSGYNSITTEPVKTPMRYYWDSSHFKENVGNLILDRIFSDVDEYKGPNDFGVVLTPSNVKESLLKTRADRTDYLERTDISELLELYKSALIGEDMDPDIAEGIY
jgi:hypothetical protein